jgi:hypothetical protein
MEKLNVPKPKDVLIVHETQKKTFYLTYQTRKARVLLSKEKMDIVNFPEQAFKIIVKHLEERNLTFEEDNQ